jgi:protease I
MQQPKEASMTAITEARILIMATDGFEQSELMVPLQKLKEKGATVEVAAPSKTLDQGKIRGWDKADWGSSVPVDKTLDQVQAGDYDALVLPGGVINPDKLRVEPKAIDIVKAFTSSGKIVAAICHGPWLLAEAGVADGRQLTSFKSIRTDMENAGGQWVDKEVVTDEGIITSRSPDDLPAFVAKIVEEVEEGRHQRAA